jgi:hypothetical protein
MGTPKKLLRHRSRTQTKCGAEIGNRQQLQDGLIELLRAKYVAFA